MKAQILFSLRLLSFFQPSSSPTTSSFPFYQCVSPAAFSVLNSTSSSPPAKSASPSSSLISVPRKKQTQSKLRSDVEEAFRILEKRRELRRSGAIPPPRDGLTVEFFLKRIGYGCEEYASTFPTWESLFETTTHQMKKNSIPTKQRRWILNWREKYLQGVNPPYLPRGKWSKKE